MKQWNANTLYSVRNLLLAAAAIFAGIGLTDAQPSSAQSTSVTRAEEPIPAASLPQHGHRLDLKAAFLMNIDMPITFADAVTIPLFPQLLVDRLLPNAPRLKSLTAQPGSPIQLISPADGLAFETWVEDASSDYVESFRGDAGEIERGPGWVTIPRTLRDDMRHVSLSYTVSAERILEVPRKGATKYQVTFGNYGDKDPQLEVHSTSSSISAGRYPAPQLAQDGDVIALELYRDDQTGQKVVDYIHVGAFNKMTLRTEAPHESYASDAEFNLTHPRLSINGEPLDAAALPETLRGPDVWMYAPGYGRYIVSFQRHPDVLAGSATGFNHIGDVTGGVLTFTEGTNVIEINCNERIAAGSGSYRVHLLRDAAWTPADPMDRGKVLIGTTPGLQ